MDDRAALEALFERVALRDRAAFRGLYAASSAKLFGVCLRILKTRAEAEEVLQETYVRIWENAARFDRAKGGAMTFMIALARNQAIDRLRTRRGETVDIDEAFDLADDTPTAEDRAIVAGETARLNLCLGELEERQAFAIRRAYLDGWTYQEAAGELGVPLNTVKTWIRRSLLKLRECLSR